MSKSRQGVRALSWDYAPGYRVVDHEHAEDQLLFAQRGVMTLTTPDGTWVVPPHRAVWIPRHTTHSIVMSGTVAMRTLYLVGPPLLRTCQVLEVSPLLRELILDIVQRGGLSRRRAIDRARLALLAAELREVPLPAVYLPRARDARLARLFEQVRANPAHPVEPRAFGLSLRTCQRLTLDETGLSFGRYVRVLRLLRALEMLAAGHKSTTVALDCGYTGASAFIAAFRGVFGATPGAYFRMRNA